MEVHHARHQTTSLIAPRVQTDPATHLECLDFIRAAIVEADRQTAQDIKNVLAEVCNSGYADRAEIWAVLSETE